MPRKLPWLADAAPKRGKAKDVPSSSPKPKRKRDSSPEDLVDSDLNAIGSVTPEQKPKRRPDRTPSTSPPPAPPDVEYMREGYNADDIYVMVEDEFLSTAKVFTQYIHHAEYVRLKKLAKSRGAGTLQAISRGTDGRTEQSNGLRMKLEAEEKRKKIRDGMKNMESSEASEAEDDFVDPQLAGLMTSEKRVKRDLFGFTKARSNTRAAAGFSQSPQNVERKKDAFADPVKTKPVATSSKAGRAYEEEIYSDDEDDLDSAPPRPVRPTYAKAEKRQHEAKTVLGKENGVRSRPSTEDPMIFKRFTEPTREERRVDTVSHKPKRTAGASEDKKLVSPPKNRDVTTGRSIQSTSASEYLAKRRADKERKEREEKRKAKRADDIPTFLF